MSRFLNPGAVLLLCGMVFNATVPAQADLAAAVLPSSRSTEVGNTVTVFTTVINAGTQTATGCSIANASGLPITLRYQTTDPDTNLPTGSADTPVDLGPGESRSFVLSLTPTAPIDAAEVPFNFGCESGATAGTINGVNTLLLSASNTPVVDVIALAATGGNTGVLSLDDSAGAFALATVNIGAPDTVTVAADTADENLPVALSLCETNPTTGACLDAPATSVDVVMPTGAMPTFSVFSQASAEIANDPAVNRVFVRFTDSSGGTRGGTSVALANELSGGAPPFSESTLKVLRRVFELAFGGTPTPNDGGGLAARTVTPQTTLELDETIMCETGQLRMTGTSESNGNSSTLSMTLDFQGCDGLNGMLTMMSTASIDGDTATFEVVQNGSYSAEECSEIRMTDVRISGEFSLPDSVDDVIEDIPFTTSGTISGVCEGKAFSCSLDGVNLQNESEFIENCSA